MQFDGATRLSRNADVVCAPVDDGSAVAMSVASSRFYGFDPVALRIWELLDTPRAMDALLDQLLDEFDVDRATCEADLVPFVAYMVEHGLVTAG